VVSHRVKYFFFLDATLCIELQIRIAWNWFQSHLLESHRRTTIGVASPAAAVVAGILAPELEGILEQRADTDHKRHP